MTTHNSDSECIVLYEMSNEKKKEGIPLVCYNTYDSLVHSTRTQTDRQILQFNLKD